MNMDWSFVLGVTGAVLGVVFSVVWFVYLRRGVNSLKEIREEISKSRKSNL